MPDLNPTQWTVLLAAVLAVAFFYSSSVPAAWLAALTQPLRDAGVRTVNVSLDALEPELYRRITSGNLADVLAGIRASGGGGI